MSAAKRTDTVDKRTTGRAGDDRRWRLEDQKDFLQRSLADLRGELEAGDIEARDFEALSARDEERLAAVETQLAGLEEAERAAAKSAKEPAAHPEARRRRRRLWLAIVAVVALSAGTTLLVVHLASPRLPGQPPTGGVSENTAQRIQTQLAQATVLVNERTPSALAEALSLYRQVLGEDPNQPQALAETGYLEWEAGYGSRDAKLENEGAKLVQRSLTVQPDDYGAHLFLGNIDLEQDHDAQRAAIQYATFLAEHPPKDEVARAAPLIEEAYSLAGRPVPAGVPAR